MAIPGPKPKPVEQAKRDGTRPSRVPNPPLRTGIEALLEVPSYFNDFQKKAWEQLYEMLDNLQVLDSADFAVLETAAAMLGRMREARHELNRSEMISITSRGAEVPSPWWKIEREAALIAQRALTELGLSPTARARLANGGTKSNKSEDKLDDLLGAPGRMSVIEGGKQ